MPAIEDSLVEPFVSLAASAGGTGTIVDFGEIRTQFAVLSQTSVFNAGASLVVEFSWDGVLWDGASGTYDANHTQSVVSFPARYVRIDANNMTSGTVTAQVIPL